LEKFKGSAASLLNTQYNKAVYSGVVGASVDFLYGLLAEFGVDVSAGLQTKTLILAMALTALLVKNREKEEGEATGNP
jgi:hypothetical protein